MVKFVVDGKDPEPTVKLSLHERNDGGVVVEAVGIKDGERHCTKLLKFTPDGYLMRYGNVRLNGIRTNKHGEILRIGAMPDADDFDC